MTHARLTHPTRETLTFRQVQNHEQQREAVANITNELGTDRASLVHTETREVTVPIRGSVTGGRQAGVDGSTSDWRQAIANYVDTLEAHVDEFQGTGYTLENDRLDTSLNAVIEAVEWSVTPGQIYEVDFEMTLRVGRGTFEDRVISRRDPTVDTGMDVMLRIDGNDLPGMRDYRAERSIGLTPKAVFNRTSAENNDNLIEEGKQQRYSFEGSHTGTLTQRQNADAALSALVGTENSVTLETKFPGYNAEVFVVGYSSILDQRFGGNKFDYQIEMVEGTRA